ncbi:hypothetical protein D9615_002105 [Tricholomella constricta]|uniref:Uncharacterized protein n=1 Tax=Tricholomella constricta TaxID=117010 RepID=A0A8H5MAQ7_9AGAR|nr:hypothetical protein D9615_002105 [Tricholomella constricta]
MAAVWAGLEWATLLFIVVKCTRKVHLVESRPLTEHEGTGVSPRPMLFVSFILCTISTTVFSSGPSPLYLLDVLAYLATAPHRTHYIALFVASLGFRTCPDSE